MKSSALFRLLYLQGADPEPTEAQTGSIPLQFLRDSTEHRGEALKIRQNSKHQQPNTSITL